MLTWQPPFTLSKDVTAEATKDAKTPIGRRPGELRALRVLCGDGFQEAAADDPVAAIQAHRVSMRLTIRTSAGTSFGLRIDHNGTRPDVSSWKLIANSSPRANTRPSPEPIQST